VNENNRNEKAVNENAQNEKTVNEAGLVLALRI
jgi:hypothetical protein